MKTFIIIFDSKAGMGCEGWISLFDNWIMEGETARPEKIEISESELESNRRAEDVCTVDAIKIECIHGD